MWARLQTFFVVVVLTGLIWVYAERRVTRSAELSVDVSLDSRLRETHPHLLVRFIDPEGRATTMLPITLTVSGPTGRIQAVDQRRLIPEPPVVNLGLIGYEDSGAQTSQVFELATVRDLFDERLALQGLDTFLVVTQANPAKVAIRVQPLVQRTVPVRVYDWSGAQLFQAQVEPERVNAWIIPGRPAEARVVLNQDQQNRAAENALAVNATVRVEDRASDFEVRVRLPRGDVGVVNLPRLGVVMPPTMQGRFRVNVEDDPQLREPIRYRGSAAAMEDFGGGRYHLLLEVQPEDQDRVGEPIDRLLRYALPDDHPQLEILDRRRILIRFHLEPLASPGQP